jgi:alanine-glyoxylate transaminase / serine-glyoxylate transaminase / serine-pyruvate transaminase
LSCPPGLAPFTVSPRAMERLKARKSPIREWYLDLRLLEEYYDGPHKYHHTAPISMFYALHQALAVISEEGLEQRWKRHHDSHRTFVNRIEALGLQMHVAEGHRIWNLNTPRIPDGINDAAVRKTLLEQDGIEILGGFGQLAGKVFRIGVMGPLATSRNLDFFFERFSKALTAAGYSIPATAIR